MTQYLLSQQDYTADALSHACEYMVAQYDKPITIEDISQVAGFSPYYFIRLFRDTYNETPYQFLRRKRIDKAKELLRTSNFSIEQICTAVGYTSLGSFTTLFQKTVGLSPARYRETLSPSAPSMAYIPLCYQVIHGITHLP